MIDPRPPDDAESTIRRSDLTPPPVPADAPHSALPPLVVGDAPHDADCPCPPPLRERVACLTQGLLVPKEKAITVPAWKLRDVEVGRLPDLKLDFVEQKHIVTETKLEEREVGRRDRGRDARPAPLAVGELDDDGVGGLHDVRGGEDSQAIPPRDQDP